MVWSVRCGQWGGRCGVVGEVWLVWCGQCGVV